MDDAFLTTAEAAQLAGTGVSSIKRWAEHGTLPCVRTAGGHRRFRRSAVEELRGGPAPARPDPVDAWVDLLCAPGTDAWAIESRLADERRARGSWHGVADFLGRVLARLGQRWASGTASVVDEHVASERLARALARAADGLPAPGQRAPVCLLVAADGDDHTLGLSLVEVCLREAGWQSRWSGRATPTRAIVGAIGRGAIDMIAVSASLAADRRKLARQAAALSVACAHGGVALALGGGGPWPPCAGGHRFAELGGFHRFASARVHRGRR